MGFDEDLESGNAFLKVKYKHLLRYWRSPKTKPVIYLFIFVTICLLFKLAYFNYETSDTVISIEETPYSAFIVKPELIETPVTYTPIVIKTSAINMRMQELNLKDVESVVQEYLAQTDNICIHLSHFGVPYDITVFHNMTIINPTILSESVEVVNIKEMNVHGDVEWKKRPTSLYIKYLKINGLVEDYISLYSENSYCLLHYNLK